MKSEKKHEVILDDVAAVFCFFLLLPADQRYSYIIKFFNYHANGSNSPDIAYVTFVLRYHPATPIHCLCLVLVTATSDKFNLLKLYPNEVMCLVNHIVAFGLPTQIQLQIRNSVLRQR